MGMKSDHSAVRLEFTNRSIKFKTKFIKKPVIDWKNIKEKDDVYKKFNVNLRNPPPSIIQLHRVQ